MIEWIDIQKVKPHAFPVVLACDAAGMISIQETSSVVNVVDGIKRTWFQAYEYGEGLPIIAWAHVPEPPTWQNERLIEWKQQFENAK